MVSFEKFQEISKCVIVGSRLIAVVNGTRNVPVGTLSAKGFVMNPEGEALVAAHAKQHDEEISVVAAQLTADAEQSDNEVATLWAVKDESKQTFTQRAAAARGKKK